MPLWLILSDALLIALLAQCAVFCLLALLVARQCRARRFRVYRVGAYAIVAYSLLLLACYIALWTTPSMPHL